MLNGKVLVGIFLPVPESSVVSGCDRLRELKIYTKD